MEQAAERLGGPFTIDWLKGHLAQIPHLKTGNGTGRGGRVGFSEAHLAEIVAMFSVAPAAGSEPGDFPSMVSRGRRRAS
jgi:hypothetical protein